MGRGGVKLAHALDVFGIDVDGPRRARRRRVHGRLHRRPAAPRRAARRRARRRARAARLAHPQRSARRWSSSGSTRGASSPERLPPDAGCSISSPSTCRSSPCARSCPVVPPLLAPGARRRRAREAAVRGRARRGRQGRTGADAGGARARRRGRVTRGGGARIGRASAMTDSPITGTEGNREFLLHLRVAEGHADDRDQPVAAGPVKRVGIVAKRGSATRRRCSRSWPAWLERARRRGRVRDRDGGARAGGAATAARLAARSCRGRWTSSSCSAATARCSAMADRIAQAGARRPDPRRELRQPRLPDRDHAAGAVRVARVRARRAGARSTTRMMLRGAHAARRRDVRRPLVLNDIVVTRAARCRASSISRCPSTISS